MSSLLINRFKMIQFRFNVDNFFEAKIALGALNDVLFEPLLAHFNTLMEAYQAQGEEE